VTAAERTPVAPPADAPPADAPPADAPTGHRAPPAVLTVGVLRERAAGERRVALTPDGVERLRKLGCGVLVESGAGTTAGFFDADYAASGAELVDADTVLTRSGVLVCVRAPGPAQRGRLTGGQALIGLLEPAADPELMNDLNAAGVTAISLDGLPRTLSSAQSMDALTSQANVAGYKAALVAANAYGGFFPMLMTAAGTVRPATVLVIGAGVAGLQAIGTARRLGAVVTGYDVRDAARSDIASTGAKFLELGRPVAAEHESASAAGGYARALTSREQADQQSAMVDALSRFDVVITTAQVPGRRPPVLVSTQAIAAMRPGSVVVDLAAGALGGNVEGSLPDQTVVSVNQVTIIGAGNLPSSVPTASSTAYSRNICALLGHLVEDGRLDLDLTDDITAGVLITRSEVAVHTESPAPAENVSPPTSPAAPGELVTTGKGTPS
jgi:NAD(P) transhydrogenase subunit alpha